jgi:Tol biopolymer transport system component
VWVDRKAREEAITAPPRAYLAPRLSPDGTQLALDVRDQENDIWIWNIARQTLRRLTFDPAMDRYPVWTPDGRRIVFSSQRSGASNLFWQAADGTGAAEPLAESSTILYASSVSADGTQVVFEQQGASTDVMMAPLAGERRATSLVATTFNERNADLSADGRWIAYQSDESGRNEVYVRPFPEVDAGRWQLSSGGGSQPAWSPNSRELFYVDPEERIIAVPIQPGSPMVAGSPQVVVDGPYSTTVPAGPIGRMYDVSRDGQRFLLLKAVEGAQQTAPPPQIVVVQHWFEELKGLASAR